MVMTVLGVGLGAWQYFGLTGVSYIAAACFAIWLARWGGNAGGGILLGGLLGAILLTATWATSVFFDGRWWNVVLDVVLDDWLWEWLRGIGIPMASGFALGVTAATYECIRKRSWRMAVPAIGQRRVRYFVGVSIVLLSCCVCSPWILEWHELTNPEANLFTYGIGDRGEQLYKFYGYGMDDQLLADRLANIPNGGRQSFLFRYTHVTDQSIETLKQFPKTVTFDLRGTLISAEGTQELRRQLPNNQILR